MSNVIHTCVIALCIGLVGCSRTIPNTTTVLGCDNGQSKVMSASGITRCGQFYLISDQHKTMQRYDPESDRLTNIQLLGLRPNARLTGITTFNDMLYAIDGVNSVIYKLDTLGQVQSEFTLSIPYSSTFRNRSPGIAIDATNKRMYVVQPLGSLFKMLAINAFEFDTDAEGSISQPRLLSGNEITIRRCICQVLLHRRFTYTDISYDKELKRMVFLRTRRNKTVIDEMEVNQVTGALIPTLYRKEFDASKEVRSCGRYPARVRGIYAEASNYYVVTNSSEPLFIRIRARKGEVFEER